MVDALLSAGDKKVRAITRNASSQKATDLASRGVEVIEADLNDKASLTKVGVSLGHAVAHHVTFCIGQSRYATSPIIQEYANF